MYTDSMRRAFRSLTPPKNFQVYIVDEEHFLTVLAKEKEFNEHLEENNLISKHPHCAIKRTHPAGEKINDLDFEILKIEYPQLIHKFKHYEVITEITIREKQRAVGVQPMLYFCFPITELISDTHLIGRCANLKEFADFKINKDNSFIIVEMIKIFGMLSPSHKHDTIEIIDLVIKSL